MRAQNLWAVGKEREASPFAVTPKDPGLRKLNGPSRRRIAEFAFTEWTSDGSIRPPSFQGLREDKSSKEVVREVAGNPSKPRKRNQR